MGSKCRHSLLQFCAELRIHAGGNATAGIANSVAQFGASLYFRQRIVFLASNARMSAYRHVTLPQSLPTLPIQPLAQTWLEIERQRSDPDGKWNKEHDWAQSA
jgi:hypothetical protein